MPCVLLSECVLPIMLRFFAFSNFVGFVMVDDTASLPLDALAHVHCQFMTGNVLTLKIVDFYLLL
jgi:hypothetical protein